jgi:hypothetical protein
MRAQREALAAFLAEAEQALRDADAAATAQWKAGRGLWNRLKGPPTAEFRRQATTRLTERLPALAERLGETPETLPYFVAALVASDRLAHPLVNQRDHPLRAVLGLDADPCRKVAAIASAWRPFDEQQRAGWMCPRCRGTNDGTLDEVCRWCGEEGPREAASLMQLLYPQWADLARALANAPRDECQGDGGTALGELFARQHPGIERASPDSHPRASSLAALAAGGTASGAALYRELVNALDFAWVVPAVEKQLVEERPGQESVRLREIVEALGVAVKDDPGRAHALEVVLGLIADARKAFPGAADKFLHCQVHDRAGVSQPGEVVETFAGLMAPVALLFRAQLMLLDAFAPDRAGGEGASDPFSTRVQLMVREGVFRGLQPDGLFRFTALGALEGYVDRLTPAVQRDLLWAWHCAVILQDRRALDLIADTRPLRTERFVDTEVLVAGVLTNYRMLFPSERYVYGGAPPAGYGVIPTEVLAGLRDFRVTTEGRAGRYWNDALRVLPFLQNWPAELAARRPEADRERIGSALPGVALSTDQGALDTADAAWPAWDAIPAATAAGIAAQQNVARPGTFAAAAIAWTAAERPASMVILAGTITCGYCGASSGFEIEGLSGQARCRCGSACSLFSTEADVTGRPGHLIVASVYSHARGTGIVLPAIEITRVRPAA